MGKAAGSITVVLLVAIVVLLPFGNPERPFLAAASPPNSPYKGAGGALNIQGFARNASVNFGGAQNDTAFSYLGSWYPAGYQGYRLHAEVGNLTITADPVPNGDFELFDEPGNNWTLVSGGSGGLVQSINRTTGGNLGYCLDTQLKYGNVPGTSVASIENDPYIASSFQPATLVLQFDIRFSSDITAQSWLLVNVSVQYQGGEVGRWSNNTAAYHPTGWEHHRFNTTAVSGPVILRITIQKNSASPSNVRGHVYFDNFRCTISSSPSPSEVGLALNGTVFVNSGGSNGSADIYADPIFKERASAINCWSATQQFQFSATYVMTFNYNYSMYIKMENADTASTFFTAPADATPTWVTNYTIPSGGAPSGHTGYRFGLILPSGWTLSVVKNATGGTVSGYSYDPLSRFFLLNEGVGAAGQTFSIYASSSNHILQIRLQRGPTSSGPWVNITPVDFFVTGDHLRAFAQLEPIEATGNSANVSVFFPNGTLWRSDSAPIFDANLNTLTSVAWQVPAVTEATAGDDWLVTVSFNSATQCGMRTQPFAAYIEPKGSAISPPTGSRHLWGSTVFINVTWRNNASLTYVTGADVQVRYIDRYSQLQYAPMSSNGQGAYSWNIPTSLLRPSRAAELDIEFRKVGYVNATYSQATHVPVVFNLVNDLDYHMVQPVQSTRPNEYTGETAVSVGFVTQVRLYDLFEVQYARNDTTPWSGAIRVNCSRYEDTGSGWVFAGTGNFLPNSGDPTLFEKVDANYSASLLWVKYTATARFVGGSCDYQQQNFTVIIKLMAFASNLDAQRTTLAHPPSGTGDGWTVFVPASDSYEVRLYAGECLNITVYYENVTALPRRPISDASVDILVLGSWLSLSNRGDGYYNYTLNTLSLDIGATQLKLNASRADCASQTIIIYVVIASRPCQLKLTSLVVDVTWGDTFWIVAYYNDTLSNQPITGAVIQYQWGPASGALTPMGAPGWYNISLPTEAHVVGQESLTLTVSHGKYQDCEVVLSIRIAARATNPSPNLMVLIFAVALIALVSVFLTYSRYLRPRVLRPRRMVHEQRLQDVAGMFGDVNNLSRFLVLHRGSGIAIFDPFSERGMDAAIFGGFLQAISAFAVDVARTTEGQELPLISPLHEISYEGFRILIHDGRFVRTALVFKGTPSEKLKKKMKEFTTRFEEKYFKELGEWCCEPEAFQDATGLLEEIFHVSLLLPHKVQPKLPQAKPLADLESKLYGIALAQTQHHDTVLLQEVANAYAKAFKADKLEVLSALYQLREKKLLVPIEFYLLTKKAREQFAPEPKAPDKSKPG